MKLLIILGIAMLLLSACSPTSNIQQDDLVDFATCLTDQGAKMYGTFWCSHCSSVKNTFGDGFDYINYIECDPRGDDEQSEFCIQQNIMGYPTWEFSDGTIFEGEPSLEFLSEKTSCPIIIE